MLGGVASVAWGVDDTVEALTGEFDLPMISYTPFAIFSNTIPIFDINFFSPNTTTTGNIDLGQGESEITYASESSASILQATVATWYVTLRTIAVVGLLSVLVYIGIRILIGSASEKAKYKELIVDWIVAFCLLFVLHYIMIFIVNITERIDVMFASGSIETILVKLPEDTEIDGEQLEADSETGYPIWACNFVGYSRLIAGGFIEYDTMRAIEFTIIYTVLVIYTVMFTIVYLKRVLYMAFLTMIAPLVALTYPIDKINDGKAQGFDTWLREYIFNALIQPFHMLIYTIIIGSVMELSLKYPIYALVALGFLIPAEKMLRRMFGFEKAQSPASMGALGVAGAGLIMSGINKLAPRQRKSSGDGNGSNQKRNNNNIRMKRDSFDAVDNFASEHSAMPSMVAGGTPLNNEANASGTGGQVDYLGAGGLPRNNPASSSPDSGDMPRQPRMSAAYNSPDSGDMSGLPRMSAAYSSPDSGDMSGLPRMSAAYNSPSGMDTSRSTNNSNNRPKRKIRNRLGNAVMSVGTRYSRKFANAHPLRALRRGVTYGLGAASLGMVGLAAGIASGDLGKTAQYTATAGIVGGRMGSNLGETLSAENRANAGAFMQGWYGEDYPDKLRDKAIKEMQSDPDNIQYLRERTSDYRRIIKEDYPEYARYGCSDIEDFWAAYQLEQAGASRASAISTYQLAQRTGDISKSPDAESKWEERLNSEFSQTPAVIAHQEQAAREFELLQQRIEAEYEEARKKVERDRKKDQKAKEEKYKKLQKQREEKLEELKEEQEERLRTIRMMPGQLTKSALKNVKQFYQNK